MPWLVGISLNQSQPSRAALSGDSEKGGMPVFIPALHPLRQTILDLDLYGLTQDLYICQMNLGI